MDDNRKIENLKGAITLADSAIKSLILVNGAAGGGLLTFYGNHDKIPGIARTAMHGSLISFGTGVFAAVFCSLLAYLSQRIAATTNSKRGELFFANSAMLAALISAGGFANGLYLASCALS